MDLFLISVITLDRLLIQVGRCIYSRTLYIYKNSRSRLA